MEIWEAGTGIWEGQHYPSDPRDFLSTGKGESREFGCSRGGIDPDLDWECSWGEALIPSQERVTGIWEAGMGIWEGQCDPTESLSSGATRNQTPGNWGALEGGVDIPSWSKALPFPGGISAAGAAGEVGIREAAQIPAG